jgi:hypothetical protein
MNILSKIATAIVTLVAIDFAGFIGWIVSGQTPVDGFYLGRITVEVIKFFI